MALTKSTIMKSNDLAYFLARERFIPGGLMMTFFTFYIFLKQIY